MGLGGVTVQLSGVSSASAVTDDNGQYAFTGLRMGNYSVEISGFDSDEVGFSATAAAVTVGVGESKIISFDGTYLRTAGIMGRVSVEGAGLEGVTVSLAGGPDNADMTTETDAAGQYSFAKLRAGDYAVGISGYNTDDFEFELTSQNVTVALGETANVPFEGVLLRTSGVSGRVSVEGIGLEGVMVTLSMADAEDMTAMTDAGGLYAFAGLAAGDYTVAIALSEEQTVAYVFESTSMDVTVGDDETAIVNFEAEHAATASVSGTLFIDELMKNDMHDEGEYPLPHAGVPVVLVGPGVNDQMPSATDSTGAYSFMGLKAGDYQLVVPVTGPMGDFAYGGSATGYALAVGVGQAVMQNIPIDITHTTVHFGVTLKAGETRGMPVPGAMVTLFADADGENMVGEGMTAVNEDGHAVASIRIARAGTSGNMVHAGVAAEGYTGDGSMTAVAWDPQKTYTQGANANDLVNLNVDVTVGGATVDRGDYGGGDALAGWAISVMSGDDAVEGAPSMLDDDGMAAFMATVGADDLPATYTFAVDTVQDNDLDGGENFEGTSVDYTHTGLSLAGTMDAGSMEVTYTTQTLKVYVHHERDQVHGYTGNILGGDARASGMIDVDIRYINDVGRSRPFPSSAGIKKSDSKGVVTFTGVPADHDVIAVADEAADSLNVMLIDPDELAAYTAADGATGGMFGENGGFSHTVELCPLMGPNPSTQDHDECGSFAFVTTHQVRTLVWMTDVVMSGVDEFKVNDPTFVDGISVTLDPVEGKNLAGEAQSFTTLEEESKKGAGDDHMKDFGQLADGVYKLGVTNGWRARLGDAWPPKGATAMVGNALNPLASDVFLDVTPTSAAFYGRVTGDDGFALDSVTVTVNGVSADTDNAGRYIVRGVSAETRKIGSTTHTSKAFVTASRPGFDDVGPMVLDFASNTVNEHNIALEGTAESASVSGTVTAFGSDTPIAGVEIQVDGGAPMNKNAKSPGADENDIYVTGSDGAYTIRVPATGVGVTSTISAHRDGFTFSPASLELSTPKGSAVSGINFQGVANSTIRGRVQAPGGGPLEGVAVTATGDNGSDADTTGVTGTYSLSVPAGKYMMAFSKDGYSFEEPEDGWDVTVGLGQTVTFAQVESDEVAAPPSDDATLSALSLSDGVLDPAFSSDVDEYTADVGVDVDTITVTATANDADADTVVIMPADADTAEAGHQVALMDAGTDTEIMVTVTAEDTTTTMAYTVTVSRSDGHQAPSAPTSLTVTPGDQGATVTWRAPRQIGSTAITTYDWEATAPGQVGDNGTVEVADGVAGLFTANVTGLVNGATYTFSVYAVNQKPGDPDPINVRGPAATATAKAQPSITLALSATTLTEGDTATATRSVTATVTLSQPSTEDITVTVTEMVEDDATAQVAIANADIVITAGRTTAAAGADATTITAIDDVVADDGANAMVAATSDDATDAAAQEITITDNDAVPGAPRDLQVAEGNAQLTLEWNSPENSGSSPVMDYQYRFSTEALDAEDAWVTVTGGASARTVTIGNLTNGTAVNVEVRAVSAAGDGTAAADSGTPTAGE